MKTITQSKLNEIVLKSVARTYYAEIIKNTPGKGIVADGWEIEMSGNDVIIYNEEFGDIINFLENGTVEHIIRAKNKKFLRFKQTGKKPKNTKKIPGNIAFEKDGYVFAKAVTHPGTEARLFIHNVLSDKNIEKQFQKSVETELENYFK